MNFCGCFHQYFVYSPSRNQGQIPQPKMNIQEHYRERIESLWKEWLEKLPEGPCKEMAKRGYAVERELPHDDVLFVGMNPAFGKDDNLGSFMYDVAEKGNDFFKAIVKFAETSSLKYSNPSHHDLLFVRHTRQKDVLDLFADKASNEFLGRQLDLSAEIIRALSPKLIVVLNAGARSLFESRFKADADCPYDYRLGAYRFIVNDSTPVLFSSMLSGQRALDNGSKRSLQWHINHILENI